MLITDDNEQRPASPQLKRLQTPEQNAIRSFLRVLGPLILGGGVVCIIGGMVSFFSAFNGNGEPRHFWLFFAGMPLVFVGLVLSQFGYMGAVARYVAGEGAPVAADTVNYMADETKGAVETVAKSVAKGITEGTEAGRGAAAANFCPHCGAGVKTEFKFCPKCGKELSDA
jgi:hypothetical protein